MTRRIIAMSFPSSGVMAWYRNSIRDVSAFLDKHHKGHYRYTQRCGAEFNSQLTFFFKKRKRNYDCFSPTGSTTCAASARTRTAGSTTASSTVRSTTTTSRPSRRWSTSWRRSRSGESNFLAPFLEKNKFPRNAETP